MENQLKAVCAALLLGASLFSCSGNREHIAPPLPKKDSLLFMRSEGISTLISDSGRVRYRLIAEDWDVYNDTVPGGPATWKFLKGAILERLDTNFQADMYATADTVYYYAQHLWEMRGRVVIHTTDGTLIRTEELFYDDRDHEMWSNHFTHLERPDRELDGYTFRSDDRMTHYKVTRTRGSFERKNDKEEPESAAPIDTPRVAPSAPGKLEAEMRRRGKAPQAPQGGM